MQTAAFDYELPEAKIAKYPLPQRDQSKLLIRNTKGEVSHQYFQDLPKHLPQNSLLVCNNTKVINARLHFTKDTGASIEIFCLNPHQPNNYELALSSQSQCTWVCMVGNLRKWKQGNLTQTFEYQATQHSLTAEKLPTTDSEIHIKFSWEAPISFGEILELTGTLPIPPYLNRETEATDTQTYQTVYSKQQGSVAAPTAGLHFTPTIFEQLEAQQIQLAELTLHVGAGTFKPLSTNDVEHHQMHHERITATRELLHLLLQHQGNITAVGTTSLRSLESLYWLGCKLHQNPLHQQDNTLILQQWEDTKITPLPLSLALNSLLHYLDLHKTDQLQAETQIMVTPNYRYRVINRLITNFHQPKSTLLLIVASIMGKAWEEVYKTALAEGYRFLSYGDSSLLEIPDYQE